MKDMERQEEIKGDRGGQWMQKKKMRDQERQTRLTPTFVSLIHSVKILFESTSSTCIQGSLEVG